jgi:hypothetical protein
MLKSCLVTIIVGLLSCVRQRRVQFRSGTDQAMVWVPKCIFNGIKVSYGRDASVIRESGELDWRGE